MDFIIGVDGGGTGCRVAVATPDGTVLARATGGAANIATNFTSAHANILQTTDLALKKAGIAPEKSGSATVVLGLAGANLGDFRVRLMARLPFAKSRITSDAETTLVGAIGARDGIIGALGTGSVYGRRSNGVFTQLGGLGFLLGDDGSGARVGHDMLHHTLLAHEGVIAHSPLTREIMAEYQDTPRNLVEHAQTFTPKDFGAFAPRIVAAAQAGDENAEAILAMHTDIVRKSLDAIGFDPEKAFSMLGGLGAVFLKRLPERYQNAAQTPLGTALDGAVALARQLNTAP